MASDNGEVKHECTYTGPHQPDAPKCTDAEPPSPSADFARTVALSVLGGRIGRFHPTAHFQTRRKERNFDVFDMEYVIRNGNCSDGGKFCPEYRNHKYTFYGDIDGTGFEAVFALSADHDLIKSPLMVLITGCFKTKSGKRGKTF